MDGEGYEFVKSKGFDVAAVDLLMFDAQKVIDTLGDPSEVGNSFYHYHLTEDHEVQYFCLDGDDEREDYCSSLTVFWF